MVYIFLPSITNRIRYGDFRYCQNFPFFITKIYFFRSKDTSYSLINNCKAFSGIPLSKALYTISYMCVTAGASGLILTILYYIVSSSFCLINSDNVRIMKKKKLSITFSNLILSKIPWGQSEPECDCKKLKIVNLILDIV